MKTPFIGDLATNFTLTSQDGSIFTLSEEIKTSPIVLVFYPMEGSPVCDRLFCRINNDVDEFNAAGLKVVGINFAEPETHNKYATKKFIRLPLLSDNRFHVSKAYDSLFSIGPIKVIRYSVVGIGSDGLIKYFERGRPGNKDIISGMQQHTY